MTIADLVVNLRANVAGLIAGVGEGRAEVAGYAADVRAAADAADAAAGPAASLGDAAARGAGDAGRAAAAAVPPVNALQRAINSSNAAASGSALPRWRSALNTAATAAGGTAAAISVVNSAIAAGRFANAVRSTRSLSAAWRQIKGEGTAVAAAGDSAAAGLKRTGGGAAGAARRVKAMLPPARTLLKVLAAGAAAYGLYRGLKAVIGVAGRTRRAVRGVVSEVLTLKRTRGVFSGLIGNAGFALGSLAGGLSAVAGIGWGVSLVAEAETARVAFGTLLGSAEEADALIGSLESFSASTPFQLPDIQESARKLLAYGRGAADIEGDLQVLGDIAAATGRPLGDLADIYGRVKSTGKVSGEILNRLAERGVPIYKAFADTMGVAEGEVKSLVSGGTVGFADLQRALASTTAEGGKFAGGMAAQSRTIAGLWSTLTDNLKIGFRTAFAAGAEAIDLNGLLSETVGWVQAAVSVLKVYAAGWAESGGAGMDASAVVLAAVEHLVRSVAHAADVLKVLQIGWKYMRVGATLAVGGVLQGLASLASGIENVLNLLPGVEVEFGNTMQAMADSVFDLADDQLAEARATAGEPWPSDSVKQFFEEVRQAREDAMQAVPDDPPTINIEADVDASAVDELDGKKVQVRAVASLERNSQEAFAAISGRIRADADAKAARRTAGNTGKAVDLLKQVVKNTAGAPAGTPAFETGGAV